MGGGGGGPRLKRVCKGKYHRKPFRITKFPREDVGDLPSALNSYFTLALGISAGICMP